MAIVKKDLSWLRVPPEEDAPPGVQELYGKASEKLGFVPNVLRVYALRPRHLELWNAFYDDLMRGDSALTRPQREMIAVVVSTVNRCHYCIVSHSAALRKLTESSSSCTEEDVEALREVGWNDEEIFDIAQVVAMFNFTNRLASGLGWVPNPEYFSLGR